jgi:hypothetical protein
MKLGTKMVIIAAAVLLTFAGFNLLVSPSALDIIRAEQMRGYEVIVTASASTSPSQPTS